MISGFAGREWEALELGALAASTYDSLRQPISSNAYEGLLAGIVAVDRSIAIVAGNEEIDLALDSSAGAFRLATSRGVSVRRINDGALLYAHAIPGNTVSFSPDLGRAFVREADSSIATFDAISGVRGKTLRTEATGLWRTTTDGKWLLSNRKITGNREIVDVWFTPTGRLIRSTPPMRSYLSVQLAADAPRLVFPDADSAAHVWNLRPDGTVSETVKRFLPAGFTYLSPTGASLLVRRDSLFACGVLTSTWISRLTGSWFSHVEFVDDQYLIVAEDSQKPRLWNCASDARLTLDGVATLESTGSFLRAGNVFLATLPAGQSYRRTAGDSLGSGLLLSWDITTGRQLGRIVLPMTDKSTIKRESNVSSMDPYWTYPLSGSVVVVGGPDVTGHLIDVRTGEILGVLAGHQGSIWRVLVARDPTRVVSSTRTGEVRIWRLRDGESISRVDLGKTDVGRVGNLALSVGGKRVVFRDSASAFFWETSPARFITKTALREEYGTVSFEDDQSDTVRIGDTRFAFGNPRVLSARADTHRRRISDHVFVRAHDYGLELVDENDKLLLRKQFSRGSITQVDVSRDGRMIVASDLAGIAWVVDTDSLRVRARLSGSSELETVELSPDSRWVLTQEVRGPLGLQTGEVKLWSVASGREVLRLRAIGTGISAARFADDGREIRFLCADGDYRALPIDYVRLVVRAQRLLRARRALTPDL
jgi:WD40 repeat protein